MVNAKEFHARQMSGEGHWRNIVGALYVKVDHGVGRLLMVTPTGFILAGGYDNQEYAVNNIINEVSGEVLLHVPLADCGDILDEDEYFLGEDPLGDHHGRNE